MAIKRYADCLRLNLRVAALAACGRWVDRGCVQASYDALAEGYDATWLVHIEPVTRRLFNRVPEPPPGRVVDLGCGTGLSASLMANRWPDRSLEAVDLSEAMLSQARRRPELAGAAFAAGDMLDWLRDQPSASTALVFSGWAIGYSRSARVIRETSRILAAGGVFAFVVNLADTLGPLRRAFRRCMGEFPGHLARLVWPTFPSSADWLARALGRAGFVVAWREDGRQPIVPQPDASGRLLPWLLHTGALAGFDAMLPLAEDGPVARRFEELLQADAEPIEHHYAAFVGGKP